MTQGLEVFKDQVSKIADLGRYEDTYIAHVAEGETVVPMDVLDANPQLKALLFNQMLGMGIDPERYIVGNELNSINPITGQPEFFLKKIFKSAKKALKKIAPYAGTIAGIMGLGPGYAALIGAGAPLLAGQDAGSVLAGGLGGYGAGKAFGTRGLTEPTKGIFGSNKYAFAKGNNIPNAFNQVKTNLGFNPTKQASDAGGKKGFLQNLMTPKSEKFKAAFDSYKTSGYSDDVAMQLAEKASSFELPGGALTATLAPMALGAIGQFFDKDEDSKLDDSFYDISPKNPFMYQGATIQRSASGGMMRDPMEYEDAYADGGLSSLEEFPRMNGQISGPGGPKDDLVPAMLSDGEFVMTAKAVENAGGPQAMYNLMNRLDPESSTGMGVA
jgi:hypothetical protein